MLLAVSVPATYCATPCAAQVLLVCPQAIDAAVWCRKGNCGVCEPCIPIPACLHWASGAQGCIIALRVLQRTLSHMCAALPVAQVYVDTVGDAAQYQERLSQRYPGIRRVRRPVPVEPASFAAHAGVGGCMVHSAPVALCVCWSHLHEQERYLN